MKTGQIHAHRLDAIERFDFRDLHPRLKFGTASDRYGGWIGQIYAEGRYPVSTRKRKVGGSSLEERTLPVESVAEYFEHFSILEIDFTYYRPLLDAENMPAPNYHVLAQYAEHAPPAARFLLKAPQQFTSPVLRRSSGGRVEHVPNDLCLDIDAYVTTFLEPAADLLGERLAGVIFEQPYQRVSDTPPTDMHIGELDIFFSEVPDLTQTHLEVRSPHLLTPPFFDWLDTVGLGFTFSHWTWLPPIIDQWKKTGGRFTAANRTAVIRLLTPLRMSYEESFRLAFPFEAPTPELAGTPEAKRMIDETTALAYQALDQEVTLNVITNNRAFGNSPALTQALAHRFLDFADRKNAYG